MTTYSVLTPIPQITETETEDVLARFLAGEYAHAGTITPTGLLSDWILPDRLCVEHEHGSIYVTTTDRLRLVGTLFEALGYRELTGLKLFAGPVGVRIRPVQPQAVNRCLLKATGGRLTGNDVTVSEDEDTVVFLSHPELVQFVVLLHAEASFARTQGGELAKPPIPLSQAYAAIGYDAQARPGKRP